MSNQFRGTLRAYREMLEKLTALVRKRTQLKREFNERMEARLAEMDAESADTKRHEHSD